MQWRIQQRLIAIGIILICLLPFSVAATPVQSLYVFGDSLSDTGNVFQASLLATGKGLPAPPYFNGRFCNGSLWIDELAAQLQIPLTPVTRLQSGSTPAAINLAYGGATTGSNNTVSAHLPGLQQEVAQFKQRFVSQSAPEGLYVIWIGANDYLSQVTASKPTAATLPIENIPVEHIIGAIEALYQLGARQFLVANLPALGKTPLARRLGEATVQTLNQQTQQHNQFLNQQLNQLSHSLPQLKILHLEIDRLFDQAVAGELNFTEVQRPCFDPTSGENCPNPNQYLFWDAVHPTTEAHRYISQLAAKTIQTQQSRSLDFSRWLLLGSISLLFIGVIWFRRVS